MALAAQPQLHFPPQSKSHEPSWDEAIVPALRQRLQNESQMLTKRLSTHGISAAATAEQANAAVTSSSPPTTAQSKPSAIPRPSSEGPAKKRQRTNSTPHSAIPIPVATTRIPKAAAPSSSKTGSISSHGHTQPHSYRPSNLSNSVTGSLSGSVSRGTGASGNSNKRPKLDYNTMEPPSPSSLDSSSRPMRNGYPNGGINVTASKSYIPNEEAPFPNSASTSTEFHYEQTRLMHGAATRNAHGRYATTGSSSFDSGRPSLDEAGAAAAASYAAEEEEYRAMISARAAKRESAERPFEHWYRGEAARNGGVGELKIGKSEMLDIAQFGYARGAADKPGGATIGPGSTFSASAALRRRAGSFDGKRESWIIPPEMVDVNGAYGSKVIDESPLTDLEGDEYTTEGERNYPYPGTTSAAAAAAYPYATRGMINGASTTAVGGPGSSRPDGDDGDEDDNAYEEDNTMVLSTTPTGISSIPTARRSTVTNAIPRAANSKQPSGKMPLGASNGANTTIPAAGPSSAAAPPSKAALLGKPAGKNSKNKGKPVTKQRSRTFGSADQPPEQEQQDENEVDVEQIPFRKPPAKGNWDDIVLPAVTKKMGIEGYGLKSEEGNILEISEEVRKRMSAINPPPPIPGLFGYDSSKYRPARPEEDIQMGELGVSEPSPPSTPKANTPAALPPQTNTGRDSPLAFSHYQENLPPLTEKDAKRRSKRASAGVPAIMVSPPSAEEHARRRKELEAEAEKSASKGCCGCVIM